MKAIIFFRESAVLVSWDDNPLLEGRGNPRIVKVENQLNSMIANVFFKSGFFKDTNENTLTACGPSRT